MAKDEAKTKERKDTDLVRVKVKRAINVGGICMAPKNDGKKITPIEAVIPYERAIAHGEADVEILGNAPKGAKIGPID